MSVDAWARIGALILLALLLAVLAACVRVRVHGDARQWTQSMAGTVRVATYNTSLYAETAGGLIARLEGDDAHARKVAAVLQRVRPDVVLINEFDFDAAHRAADLFQRRYLEVAQADGGAALNYPHRFLALRPPPSAPGRRRCRRGRGHCRDGRDAPWSLRPGNPCGNAARHPCGLARGFHRHRHHLGEHHRGHDPCDDAGVPGLAG